MTLDEMIELLQKGLETTGLQVQASGNDVAINIKTTSLFRTVDLAGPNALRAITHTNDVFMIRVFQEE
jgi:hypothetical protein